MAACCKSLFWIGLAWLAGAAAGNDLLVNAAVRGTTSDYIDHPLNWEQTNTFIKLIHERVEDASMNVWLPIGLILAAIILTPRGEAKLSKNSRKPRDNSRV